MCYYDDYDGYDNEYYEYYNAYEEEENNNGYQQDNYSSNNGYDDYWSSSSEVEETSRRKNNSSYCYEDDDDEYNNHSYSQGGGYYSDSSLFEDLFSTLAVIVGLIAALIYLYGLFAHLNGSFESFENLMITGLFYGGANLCLGRYFGSRKNSKSVKAITIIFIGILILDGLSGSLNINLTNCLFFVFSVSLFFLGVWNGKE